MTTVDEASVVWLSEGMADAVMDSDKMCMREILQRDRGQE